MHLHSRKASAFTSILIALVIGAILGVVGTFLLSNRAGKDAAPYVAPARAPQTTAPAERTAPSESAASKPSEDYVARKLREWKLTPEDLKRDLGTASRILREKGGDVGRIVVKEGGDVRVIAVIKAKFTLDEGLSAWDISVACDAGRVSLTGTVNSPEDIGRAIVLALDTDGVKEVTSSLRVKPATAEAETTPPDKP